MTTFLILFATLFGILGAIIIFELKQWLIKRRKGEVEG